jgi:hypothetical protein
VVQLPEVGHGKLGGELGHDLVEKRRRGGGKYDVVDVEE